MQLKRWQKGSRTNENRDKNLRTAMTDLKRISDKLNLPTHIQQEAALIYRKMLKLGMIRGRAITEMVAASIHLAYRINSMSRRLSEIVTASGRDRKRIARYYRIIPRNLDMKMPHDKPARYIAKLVNMAKIDLKTQNRAMGLLHKAKRYSLLGKKPSGLAACTTLHRMHRKWQSPKKDSNRACQNRWRNRSHSEKPIPTTD